MSAEATLDFRCCDTQWRIHARGGKATAAAQDAQRLALALEKRLNAFDPESAVSRLNREGRVFDPHVAAIVRRATEYTDRTDGVFDISRGALEHAVKAHIREGSLLVASARTARYEVAGDNVFADAPLDLNGIAKGYIVDAAHRRLVANGVVGFVDGGGDIASPTGPVAIESPTAPGRTLGVIDTRWNVATSGNAKRRRGAIDHIYDGRDGNIGARNEQVTVVARRDCVEADVLATTLAALPLRHALALVNAWPEAEALIVHQGSLYASEGFNDHVWKA